MPPSDPPHYPGRGGVFKPQLERQGVGTDSLLPPLRRRRNRKTVVPKTSNFQYTPQYTCIVLQ